MICQDVDLLEHILDLGEQVLDLVFVPIAVCCSTPDLLRMMLETLVCLELHAPD